jgi:hypothetical protein
MLRRIGARVSNFGMISLFAAAHGRHPLADGIYRRWNYDYL